MRQLLVVVVLTLVCGAAQADDLFNPVGDPVQPVAAIANILGGAPEIRSRQVTVDHAYFAAQAAAEGPSELVINLFPDVILHSQREKIVRKGNTIQWTGTVEGANVYGKAIFAVTGDIVVGLVQRDRRVFLVRPVTLHVLQVTEIRQRLLPQGGIPVLTPELVPVPPPPPPQPAELNVMVVWDAALSAVCYFPAMNVSYEMMFEGLLNSVWAQFTSVTITANVTNYCSSHSATGGNLSADLAWVSSNATIAAERDARAADLVSYMVPSSPIYCGLGYYNAPPVNATDEATAFSVVVDDCAASAYALPHEIGHNLGMEHDRAHADVDDPARCNYGFHVTIDNVPYVRTVMAYDCPAGCEIIGVHSDPTTGWVGWPFNGTVKYGEACGSATAADNVSQLEAAASVAADFRP
ncbi:MAG TPA: zinc-dependent metalloprotease family protein [Thermoanaerobaculia bacterium]